MRLKTITEAMADEDKLERAYNELSTLAEDWEVAVAEDGIEVAKKQFKNIIARIKKYGGDMSNVVTEYPNGEKIE